MRKNKYGAKKRVIDGITFDSIKESRRYQELRLMERAGIINNLEVQPHFTLQKSYKKNGRTVQKIEYIADFMYWDNEKEKTVVEDVKGVKTQVYQLKKKIFEFLYPYEIDEI